MYIRAFVKANSHEREGFSILQDVEWDKFTSADQLFLVENLMFGECGLVFKENKEKYLIAQLFSEDNKVNSLLQSENLVERDIVLTFAQVGADDHGSGPTEIKVSLVHSLSLGRHVSDAGLETPIVNLPSEKVKSFLIENFVKFDVSTVA